MIKKFDKDTYEYHNAIQLTWLFLLTELHEFFIFIGAYDPIEEVYNYRRVFWSMWGVIVGTGFVGLLSLTCVLYIVNFFMRLG